MTGKKYLCGKCKKDLGKTGSVQCYNCVNWLHPQCAGITDEFLVMMSKNGGLSYKCEDCINNPNNNNSTLKDEISLLNKKLDSLSNRIDRHKDTTDKKLEGIVFEIRNEFVSRFEKMDQEVLNCYQQVKVLDASLENKISKVEADNNALQHRMNRTDVVVNGLPAKLKVQQLEEKIKKIGSFFGMDIGGDDIQHVCYMNKSKSVLVKFTHVRIRDRLMAEYFKTKSLKLCDVDESGIDTRVFINDHFSPFAARMFYVCRKMVENKKIAKFKIFNADKPKVLIWNMDKSADKKKKKRKPFARHFTEGWVEFESKRVAKQIVPLLNNKQISSRKKSQFFDYLWSMKYLPRFKWCHLTERMNYETAVHKQRLMTEVSQARKEATFFQNNLDKSEFIKKKEKNKQKMKEKKLKKQQGEV